MHLSSPRTNSQHQVRMYHSSWIMICFIKKFAISYNKNFCKHCIKTVCCLILHLHFTIQSITQYVILKSNHRSTKFTFHLKSGTSEIGCRWSSHFTSAFHLISLFNNANIICILKKNILTKNVKNSNLFFQSHVMTGWHPRLSWIKQA